jgi:hypothetical protein
MAMQYEISDRGAIEFARAFYEAVADGLPVDLAVRDARLAVSLARPNSLEWGTPVLYLRPSSGQLFVPVPRKPDAPAPAVRRRPPPPPTAPPPTAPPRARARPAQPSGARSGTGPRPRPRPPAWTRRTVATVAAVLAVLAVVGLVALSALRDDGPGARRVVTVPADQQWTDSGIDLRKGQAVRLVASGEIYSAPGVRNGPAGDPELHHPMALLPGTRHAALIARIGDAGPMFVVGRGASGAAVGGGRLYLGINDLAVRDNSGYFQVEVTLTG